MTNDFDDFDDLRFKRDKANRDFDEKREKFRGEEYGHKDNKRSKDKKRKGNDKRKFLDEDEQEN